jgi:hypothetical protein
MILMTNLNHDLNIEILNVKHNKEISIIAIKNGEETKIELGYKLETAVGVEINLIENTFSAALNLCFSLGAKFDSLLKKAKVFKLEAQIVPGFNLEIDIKPFLDARICFGFGYYRNMNDPKDTHFFVDAYGEAEVGLNLEAGVYVPSSSANVYYGVIIGLKGVFGSGKVGMHLQ